jgi:glycine cleavage system transcriptional repressor
MSRWFMLTVVGEDRPGIVARITAALYAAGCNLGEASMIRLGGNFTIMLMVGDGGDAVVLEDVLKPVADSLGLHLHIDPIAGHLHRHEYPDVRVTVFGADRAGIVAEVTTALAQAGMNILDLESDVAGNEETPIYVMHIEGQAARGIEAVRAALAEIARDDIEVEVKPVDTLIG